MRCGRKFGAALWLLLVAVLPGVAQTSAPAPAAAEWIARSWQTKDGLSQSTPYALLQSRDGYLWVGTGGGVTRFDGVRFDTFGLRDGLGSLQVLRLCEDRAGVLWAGTVGGGLSRWEGGRFRTYGKEEGLAAGAVQALAGDADGSLWVGTEAGLVHRQDGRFTKVGPEAGLPEGQVRALLVDSKGTLWVAVLGEGLYARRDGRFTRAESNGVAPRRIYCLLEDARGGIWAGGGSGRVWEMRHGRWKRHGETNGLPQNDIQSLAQDEEGTLWVGTRGGGLYFSAGDGFHKFGEEADSSMGFVTALCVDREQGVWAGLAGLGLHRFSRRSLETWGKAEGLADAKISSVAEDSSGALWVTTLNDGTWRFQQRQFSRPKELPSGNPPNAYATTVGVDGSIWTAGEQFLMRFRPGQLAQKYLAAPVRGEAIRALCADGTNLWLGTYYSTLLYFDGSEVRVVATNGSFGGGITSLAREGPEALWIGTSDGLYRWRRGKVQSWGTGEGLLTSNIGALHRDADGTLWIGTFGGGLARLREGRILNITKREGLVDDVISQIVADDFGNLWLGCNRGIMSVARREIDSLAAGAVTVVYPVVFGANEGMLNEQCAAGHSPTAVKTRDGSVIFPTMGGLVRIDPRRLHPRANRHVPTAIIEEVRLDDVPQAPGRMLVVPPGNRRVEVQYAAPSLRAGERVRFRTRLVGWDKDWVLTGSRRSASYAGLRPGRYEFQVTACDSSGVWNEWAVSVPMVVQPEFWRTAWFGGVLLVVASGMTVAWYRHRVGELHARHRQQETFTRQLIKAQEGERARLARELHDDITQRLALLAIDAGCVERVEATPQISRAMRGVREGLVRLSEDVHALSHQLHSSLLEDLGLAEALKVECERFARHESIAASLKVSALPPAVTPDVALALFRITQEALRNVARHARASAVEVTLRAVGERLELVVQDNGVGFGVARTREHFGLGLASMRERAGLLGGELHVESAPGRGTTVVAGIPLKGEKT